MATETSSVRSPAGADHGPSPDGESTVPPRFGPKPPAATSSPVERAFVSHLAVLGHPGAVVAALEVLEEPRDLGDHELRHPVEDQPHLLLGAGGGAHLDDVADGADVHGHDQVGA